MGQRFGFNLLPRLLPGEKVLLFKKWIWAASGKCSPSYRLFFGLPPLWELGLYVTHRRLVHVSFLCRLMMQEFSQWFEQEAPPGDQELVREVSVARNPLFGPYLEVISEDPGKHWYRAHRLRVRLFTKDAARLCAAISEAMTMSAERRAPES